ncbi:MAG: zinc ribbon domain-containing protein [Chloroflexi bacterium]|nr:zinc ribbon domain-containing protein [Chloroflexota bacterium]
MPVYEYDCEACGDRFDKLVLNTARDPKIQCPRCGSDQVSKRLSLIASSSGGSRGSGTPSAACTTST